MPHVAPPLLSRASQPHVLRRFAWRALIAAGLAFGSAASARAEKLVTVQASADAAYVQRADKKMPRKPESFVLTKGQLLPGAGTDAELRKTEFSTVATILADDLKKRFPVAENLRAADTVIVVHWGITKEQNRTADLLAYDPDTLRQKADEIEQARAREQTAGTELIRALDATATAQSDYNAEARLVGSLYRGDGLLAASNAELLGYGSSLAKDDDTAETLRAMLNEERYVVILVAYDGAELRAGKKVRLWTTRASIRAAGVNLKTALERMSNVAERFHGTAQPELILADAKDRRRS